MVQNSDVTRTRDRWDKIDILLKPMGGLFTGIALATVGYFTTDMLKDQEAKETNRRLYAEIMSSREKSDSDLRKEMFNSIIKAFLDPDDASLSERVLALELLAYNFHDVIDISPLFKYVAKSIEDTSGGNVSLMRKLESIAQDVSEKQVATLREAGIVGTMDVSMEDFNNGKNIFTVELYPIRANALESSKKRYVAIEVLDVLSDTREIRVRLESGDINNRMNPEIEVNFKVGFFDFPMIDNIRLSHSQRIAVVLDQWNHSHAQLVLIYFPGSRASLKEKLYYDEVVEQLQRTNESLKKKREKKDE